MPPGAVPDSASVSRRMLADRRCGHVRVLADHARPPAGARCGKAARRDLCGGQGAIPVPTATGFSRPKRDFSKAYLASAARKYLMVLFLPGTPPHLRSAFVGRPPEACVGGRKEAFEPLDRIEHAAPRLPSVSSPMSCSHPVVASPPVKGNLEERSIYIEKQ